MDKLIKLLTKLKEFLPKPHNKIATAIIYFGITLMALVAFVFKPSALSLSFVIYFLGGVIGSAAMILPGISGSYLLLILGLYLPIIGSIHDFKNALVAFNIDALFSIGMEVILPFGLGAVAGILVLSNFLHYLLKSHKKITQSFLLGLLVGSVLGLYPFAPQPLEKLTKYQVVVNGEKVLKIRLFGELTPNDREYKKLEALRSFGTKVEIEQISGQLNTNEIAQAREAKQMLALYAFSPENRLRKLAKDKNLGVVPLVVITNTKYSFSRLLTILLLILTGAGTTYMIGKIKQKEQ